MSRRSNSPTMPHGHRALITVALISILLEATFASLMSTNFISTNTTRMVFMVNFDTASVICQKSSSPEDLALYPISALCNGVRQCLAAPNMDDESFPFCSNSCQPPCGAHGTCLLDGGKAQCYCDQGYSGKTCSVQDTNECAKKPCHWLAKCTNTYGSYYCSCLPGFSGDGLNCTDIDECSVESIASKCPPHSECSNVPGTYFCNCTAGFKPKGSPVQSCEDIDECNEKLATCPTGTACVNTVGSYKCAPAQNEAINCSGGYEIRDGKCVDIDECLKPDICAPRAICANTEGSYRCACPSGFTGDGKTCTPLTDCSTNPAICHPNAFCVSDLRMCLCQSGYIGDGISCFDMNECASDQSPCKPFEKCINTNGSYSCCSPGASGDAACSEGHAAKQCSGGCGKHAECVGGQCVCKLGFTGNPVIGCTDVDECKENPNICTEGKWCVNFQGGHVCCAHGDPISRCQGLVIGIWSKLDKARKKGMTTPVIDLTTTTAATSRPTPTVASLQTTYNPNLGCTPSQKKFCELRGNKTCTIIDNHPECTECLPGYTTVAGECVLLNTIPGGGSDCHDPVKNDCHKRATCIDLSPSGHLCACKEGFIGDGKRCDDVDECYTPSLCSSNAKCINQIGSFQCVCKPGFVGDGRSCTAVCPGGGLPHLTFGPCSQEADHCPAGFVCQGQQCCPLADVALNCELNPLICGENAKCIEKQCVCDSGFTRNGSRCRDVDECLEPVCQKDQKCFNLPGNFACCPGKNPQDAELCGNLLNNCTLNPTLCMSNTHCINGSCVPKVSDDCRTNHTLCHPNAECNKTGDGRCYCSLGYVGDGHQCKPDPEDCFLNLKLCDLTRSRCIDRRCQCLDGFRGNGTSCLKETCDTLPSLCHRNADCVKSQCVCKDGFAGNGLSCIPDPNDCQEYPKLCHAKASCNMRRCHCNDGFQGDGKTCIPIFADAKNCQLIPGICGTNAFCNQTRCHCKLGYLGDGETGCWVDPEDCVLTPSRCPKTAECVERRCKCSRGFVGNGTDCAVDLEDCQFGGLKCHQNAKCINQKKCQCEEDFEGDGVKRCEFVQVDCQANNSICHPKAECRQISAGNGYGIPSQWRCKCPDGYDGNGRQCTESGKVTPVFDLRPIPLNAGWTLSGTGNSSNETSILPGNKTLCADPIRGDCHQNADCAVLENGKRGCQCRHGFTGDGRNCEDVNECSLRLIKCHPLAKCVNTAGSHMCLCPQGYRGDGVQSCIAKNETESRDRLDVECQDDGILLLYVDKGGDGTSANFNGRIFVKTQSQNPYCSKDFTSGDGPVYKFKAPFAYCDVKAEPHNTFSVVVVIQKHPLFVTTSDEAYNLRCTYPVGELPLMSHFNVSMLATAGYYVNNGTMPQCSLRVMAQEPVAAPNGISSNLDENSKWQEVSEAVVGQRVELLLNVEPKNLYGILARNCMAINMDNGESYQLTNSRGCAVDAAIFPEWTQEHKYQLFAKFLTFKWPDTAHIRFQCDCSPCFEQCEPVQCGSSTGWGRRKRSDFETVGNERQSSSHVFSPVLRIRDTASMKYDHWQEDDTEMERNEAANQSVWLLSEYYGDAIGTGSDSEDVCMHSVIFASALGLAVSLAATVCAVGLGCWRSHRRRSAGSGPASISHSHTSTSPSKHWIPPAMSGKQTGEGKRPLSSRQSAFAADAHRSDAALYR